MPTILVPFDGSEPSLRAVEYAAKLAKVSENTTVIVLNVQAPVPSFWPEKLVNEDMLHAYYEAEGAKTLEAAELLLREVGLPCRSEVRAGFAGHTIADFAKDERVDSIVMGTRGMGAVGSFVMGSVAQKVVHLALVPVTLVK